MVSIPPLILPSILVNITQGSRFFILFLMTRGILVRISLDLNWTWTVIMDPMARSMDINHVGSRNWSNNITAYAWIRSGVRGMYR